MGSECIGGAGHEYFFLSMGTGHRVLFLQCFCRVWDSHGPFGVDMLEGGRPHR
jgi:hypothetical protein